MNTNLILYHHGGSGNHGCEAIVRSVVKILGKSVDLISFRPEEDWKFELDKIGVSIYGVKNIGETKVKRIIAYFLRHYCKNRHMDYTFQFQDVIHARNRIIISIGGDLYCGSDTESLTYLNKKIYKKIFLYY